MSKKLKYKKAPIILLLFVILFLGGLYLIFKDKIDTLNSLKYYKDGDLYVMQYKGDYKFREYMEKGAANDNQMINFLMKEVVVFNKRIKNEMLSGYGCSTFFAANKSGDKIFGRNFDWDDHPALMVFTNPKDGYASCSMIDLAYLGYKKDKNVLKSFWFNRLKMLAAPYLTLDGMNEKGLAVSCMAVSTAKTPNDPKKVTINHTAMLRLILDYAKDVEEAINLIKKYNIYFSAYTPNHFMFSDRNGDSAIIEFFDGDMNIIRKKENWQVATNFIMTVTEFPTCERYVKVYNRLKLTDGRINENDAMQLLGNISQWNTLWSEVFNLDTDEVNIVMRKNYKDIKKFKLK